MYLNIFQKLKGLILFSIFITSFKKNIALFMNNPVSRLNKNINNYTNHTRYNQNKLQPIVKLIEMKINMELTKVFLKKLYTYT